MGDSEFEYVTGQGRPSFAALLQSYLIASDLIRNRSDVETDVPYGSDPRQTFDIFPSAGESTATMIFYHAGYWQSRDKMQFSFIAGPFNGSGITCVLANYPLCPQVTVSQLVEAARPSIPAILSRIPTKKLLLAGHSAGAHIAVELALGATSEVDALIGLSGVYDLQPLVHTTLNKALCLTDMQSRASSPVHRLRSGLPRAIFAVGGEETESFIQQSRRMDNLWSVAGNRSDHQICRGDDHFSLLQSLANPAHLLHQSVVSLVTEWRS